MGLLFGLSLPGLTLRSACPMKSRGDHAVCEFDHLLPQVSATGHTARRGVTLLCVSFVFLAMCLSFERTVTAADSERQQEGASTASRPVPSTLKDVNYDLTSEQQRQVFVLEAFTSLWFFALGAAVGSFLNVVVYRMPLGIPLGRPKSSCPSCKTPIKMSDNIPILGWIRLRGRCRHCGVRIPPRYLFVEAFVAGFFLLLLYVELLSGGGNLPVRLPNHYHGVIWIIWYTKWDLIGIYLFHCFLLSVLTAATLIVWNGNRIPRKLVAWGIGVGLIAPIFWDQLRPVPFVIPRPTWLAALRWQTAFEEPVSGWTEHFGVGLSGVVDGIAGLAAGMLVGCVLSAAARKRTDADANDCSTTRQTSRWLEILFPFVLTGVYLGWQAVVSVACLSAILFVILSGIIGRWLNGIRDRSMLGCVSLAVLLQIVAWRFFGDLTWWPNHAGWGVIANRSWWPLAAWPGASLAIALIAAVFVTCLSRCCPGDGRGRLVSPIVDVREGEQTEHGDVGVENE